MYNILSNEWELKVTYQQTKKFPSSFAGNGWLEKNELKWETDKWSFGKFDFSIKFQAKNGKWKTIFLAVMKSWLDQFTGNYC